MEFGDHLAGTRVSVDTPREALTEIQKIMGHFYGSLRAKLKAAGYPPERVGASQEIAEVAFALEVALLRAIHNALGLKGDYSEEGGLTASVTDCPRLEIVPNTHGFTTERKSLDPVQWLQARSNVAKTLEACSKLLQTGEVERLYIVPPVAVYSKFGLSRSNAGADEEPFDIREVSADDEIPSSLKKLKSASFVNPHDHGGLVATLFKFMDMGIVEQEGLTLIHPSHTSSFLPTELFDLLPCAAQVPFVILHSDIEASVQSPPTFEDHEFWRSALGTSVTRALTSGDLILHQDGEHPNYYQEEKYLGPVGPVGSKARLLQKAALLEGYDTIQYSRGSFALVDGTDRHLLFHSSATPLNTAAAKAVCNDKETTRRILQRKGIPVPQGRVFKHGDLDGAVQYAESIGYPLVVKPAMGTMGIGVRAGIRNQEEFRDALEFVAASRLGSQDFIVERHIFGDEYRILVVDDEVVAAVQREPASVIGDGIHTVAELIVRKNAFRKTNPQLASSPIVYSEDTDQVLERQEMTITSVPEANQYVLLSSSSNISLGGDSREMSDRLHPSVVDAAIRAVQAIPGLNYCGVDFLLPDPGVSVEEQVTGICELNAQAATGTAQYPLYGSARPVPQKTIQAAVKKFDLVPTQGDIDEMISLRLTVRGRIMKVGFHQWFAAWAKRFDVVGRTYNLNDRIIGVEIKGRADAVAALSAAAVGGPRRSRPTSVISEHIPELDYTDFRIISKWRGRLSRWVRR